MARTLNEIQNDCLDRYIVSLKGQSLPCPADMEHALLNEISNEIKNENKLRDKGDKLRIPQTLPPFAVGQLILISEHIRLVNLSDNPDNEKNQLCIYCSEGSRKGTYIPDERYFRRKIRLFHNSITETELKSVMGYLKDYAEVVMPERNPDLVPVNNGIYQRSTRQLLPFSPDKVYTKKCRIDYNQYAQNVVLDEYGDNMPWNVEDWIADLVEGEDNRNLLWEVLSAIVRPYENWGRAIMLINSEGCNGKGSFCTLLKALAGEGNYVSIPIANFGDRFALGRLTSVSAVITDENDIHAFPQNLKSFKAAVTKDTFDVESKGVDPVTIRWEGLIVQCLNDIPHLQENDSCFRRLLFISFDKNFKECERKYIRDDYLSRKEVLEYVLKRALEMDATKFTEPEDSRRILDEVMLANDSVAQFLDEILDELVWDLIPQQFLYELYKAWFKKNLPSGAVLAMREFRERTVKILMRNPEWEYVDKKPVRPGNRMSKTEYLIYEYNLTEWQNPYYSGGDIKRICEPKLSENYKKVFLRRNTI